MKKLLNEAQKKLDEKRNKLEILEKQKADIVKRFQKANPAEKIKIEEEMKANVKQYENLLTQVTNIAEKIKTLCKKISI